MSILASPARYGELIRGLKEVEEGEHLLRETSVKINHKIVGGISGAASECHERRKEMGVFTGIADVRPSSEA